MWKRNKEQPTGEMGMTSVVETPGTKHHRRKIVIIVIAAWVLVAGICVAIGFIYFAQQPKATTTTPDVTTSTEPAVDVSKFNTVASDAQAKQAAGDTAGAAQAYTDAVATTTDKQEQAYLYASAAAMFVQGGQLDEAIKSALDAFTATPDEATADLVADTYERLGNKAQAIVYYQKAKDLVKDDDPTTYGTDYYQTRIDDLKK